MTSCGKRVGARRVATQRAHRELVGAGRAAESEIDAPGIERSSVPNCSAMTSGA